MWRCVWEAKDRGSSGAKSLELILSALLPALLSLLVPLRHQHLQGGWAGPHPCSLAHSLSLMALSATYMW